MKRINKVLELATKYREWHDRLSFDNHPKYYPQHKHYRSIVANLLHVQGGLCAYTEVSLCKPALVAPDRWEGGEYKGKLETFGHLDHYNPNLKPRNGWLWSNFFVIHACINTKTKLRAVPRVLKPDNDNFEINDYLDYDFSESIFIIKPQINDEKLRADLLHDIKCLGLNHPSIEHQRREFLSPILADLRFSNMTPEQARERIYQFYTAYEMAVKQILTTDGNDDNGFVHDVQQQVQ